MPFSSNFTLGFSTFREILILWLLRHHFFFYFSPGLLGSSFSVLIIDSSSSSLVCFKVEVSAFVHYTYEVKKSISIFNDSPVQSSSLDLSPELSQPVEHFYLAIYISISNSTRPNLHKLLHLNPYHIK